MSKKILFIVNSLASGGAEKQVVTVASYLKKRGYKVEICCHVKHEFHEYILLQNGIKVHWLIENNLLLRILRFRKFIRKGNYNAVISFLPVSNFFNCFAGIGGKKWKIITSERNSFDRLLLPMKDRITISFQKKSDYIVCNSERAKQKWQHYSPLCKNKLLTIYNTILLPQITTNYVPLKNKRLHIVIAATYRYLKNPIGLIQALVLLNESQKRKIEIHWYGRAHIGKTLMAYDESVELINKFDLQNTIYLHGETKDIANKMNEADVVALFSELEGLPNAICEAMLIGKPIIMTRVSDYNILVDGANGFLCDWNNTESIKQAIEGAMNLSKEELLLMGSVSKEKAEKLFSERSVIDEWVSIIEKETFKTKKKETKMNNNESIICN